MSNKKIDPKQIIVEMKKLDFDAACNLAQKQALMKYDIGDSGTSSNPNWERSENTLHIKFESMESQGDMSGWVHYYVFQAWIK